MHQENNATLCFQLHNKLYTVDCFLHLVYTKTVDSVFRALWLATQSVNILHYPLILLQFLRTSVNNHH